MNSYYTEQELKGLNLKSYGKNVLISRNTKIYSADQIVIGNNVRIDDFCILSGKITLGSFIHIAAGTYIYGADVGVELKDYSCLSSRCAVYAISDDYSGEYMTNPMIDDKYRNVKKEQVIIGKHSLIGTGTTILPGVKIGDGVSVGAMSLVNKSLNEFTIYAGIPCKKIKDRSKRVLELEEILSKEKR